MRTHVNATVLLAAVFAFPLFAAAQKSHPSKIKPVLKKEKARLLEAETPEQKALRAELSALNALGQFIYFNANCDGVHRIYKMNVDGTETEGLTPAPGPGGNHAHVSPDGKQLAYCAPMKKDEITKLFPPGDKYHKIKKKGAQGICIMPTTGGKPQPVAHGYIAHWSPDGKKLVYMYSGVKTRYSAIYDIESKKEYTLSHLGKKLSGFFPNISPDGKYLFIAGNKGGVLELNADGTGVAEGAKYLNKPFKRGCNEEFSKDGKWLTWVQDTHSDQGGWLHYSAWNPLKRIRPKKLPLGWKTGSVNYYPDFSPDGKYLVYSHADMQKGVKSYALNSKQELYVTRFPKCETTVRITWNGAANYHPHWWGPQNPIVAEDRK